MAETPSNRRRKGREAFTPNGSAMDIQPYEVGTYSYTQYLPDWLDGWNEAKEEYKKEQREQAMSSRVEWRCDCCTENCELTNDGNEPLHCPLDEEYAAHWERI